MITDTLANTTRAAHDVGLAAWLGGAMFGKFALNPSLEKISSRPERGSVSNAAWNGYNVVNAAGLGAAALGWGAARLTEARSANVSGPEKALSQAKDGLMAAAVLTGIANGVQGARLARQAPDGAVPVETGTKPSPETPAKAARIQRSLGMLGTLNIASGVALVAVNAILAQTNHSRPAKRRALMRSSSNGSRSPLWIGSAAASADPRTDPASCSGSRIVAVGGATRPDAGRPSASDVAHTSSIGHGAWMRRRLLRVAALESDGTDAVTPHARGFGRWHRWGASGGGLDATSRPVPRRRAPWR